MKMRTTITVLMMFFSLSFSFAADLAVEGERYFQANDWPNVLKTYSELVKKDPSSSQSWFRLARAHHKTGNYKEALNAYNEAEKRGFHQLSVVLRKARTLSMMGNSKEAMDLFKQAVDLGFNFPSTMTDDKEFANLKKDTRYDAVLTQIKRNEKPCGYDPEFRQFDFWIGDWEVFVSGSPAGKSHVELILKDCVIVENWESTSYGYNGKSYNVYNSGIKKWQQFWVDDAAGPTLYTGEYTNNVMRFDADKNNPDGSKLMTKMTFYNLGPDKVRQYIQQSTDAGKTWNDAFDGEYRRVNQKAEKQ